MSVKIFQETDRKEVTKVMIENVQNLKHFLVGE